MAFFASASKGSSKGGSGGSKGGSGGSGGSSHKPYIPHSPTTLNANDEIVCLVCSKPAENPMVIRYGKDILSPPYCSCCGILQTNKDKIHVCERENDPGHKNNAYLIGQNSHLIGGTKLIVCYRCRWRNRDKGICWDVKRNYWVNKSRRVPNEPQYDPFKE